MFSKSVEKIGLLISMRIDPIIIGCSRHSVVVYDSLTSNPTKEIEDAIADIIHTSEDSIIIEYTRMPHERGSNDCGLFCNNISLSFMHWNKSK